MKAIEYRSRALFLNAAVVMGPHSLPAYAAIRPAGRILLGAPRVTTVTRCADKGLNACSPPASRAGGGGGDVWGSAWGDVSGRWALIPPWKRCWTYCSTP